MVKRSLRQRRDASILVTGSSATSCSADIPAAKAVKQDRGPAYPDQERGSTDRGGYAIEQAATCRLPPVRPGWSLFPARFA